LQRRTCHGLITRFNSFFYFAQKGSDPLTTRRIYGIAALVLTCAFFRLGRISHKVSSRFGVQ